MKTKPAPGTQIRLTSAFLRSTGQSRKDDEGKRQWIVLACSCGLCADGRFACTDEEHPAQYRIDMWGDLPEEKRPKYRHLAVANVEVVGQMEPEPRAEVAWWTKVVPSIEYPGEPLPHPGERSPLAGKYALASIVKYHRGEVFWRWCGYLWVCGFAHGSELAEALGTPGLLPRHPTGDPDNCASADRLLSAAEEAGWIRRVSPEGIGDQACATPTREQAFFGADGRFGGDVRKVRTPRVFGWEPVRESALGEWLGY